MRAPDKYFIALLNNAATHRHEPEASGHEPSHRDYELLACNVPPEIPQPNDSDVPPSWEYDSRQDCER